MVKFSQTQVPQEYHSNRTGGSWLLPSIFLLVLLFAGIFGYFYLQASRGGLDNIAKEYSTQTFSSSNTLGANTSDIDTIQTKKLIRPHNPTRGNPASNIVILTFIDFECPYCAESYSTFNKVMEKYDGAVLFVFKHLPLTDIHPNAQRGALAAACAHDFGKFWPYYDSLFRNKSLQATSVVAQAVDLGIDRQEFTNCLTTQKHKRNVDRDVTDAIGIGAQGTPTYVINGKKLSGVISESDWDKIILSFMKAYEN